MLRYRPYLKNPFANNLHKKIRFKVFVDDNEDDPQENASRKWGPNNLHLQAWQWDVISKRFNLEAF